MYLGFAFVLQTQIVRLLGARNRRCARSRRRRIEIAICGPKIIWAPLLGVAMGAQSSLLHRRAQRGAHRSELKLPSAARGVSGPLFIFSLNSEVATMFSGAASTTPRLSLSSAPSGAQCWARRPWRGRAPRIEMDSCCRWSLVVATVFPERHTRPVVSSRVRLGRSVPRAHAEY